MKTCWSDRSPWAGVRRRPGGGHAAHRAARGARRATRGCASSPRARATSAPGRRWGSPGCRGRSGQRGGSAAGSAGRVAADLRSADPRPGIAASRITASPRTAGWRSPPPTWSCRYVLGPARSRGDSGRTRRCGCPRQSTSLHHRPRWTACLGVAGIAGRAVHDGGAVSTSATRRTSCPPRRAGRHAAALLDRGSHARDQPLDPLVDRPERVLAQHRALRLVVQLEVHPVDGEVAPPLLRAAG